MIPDALLTDGVIELRLLRVLEIGDMTRRDGASAVLGHAGFEVDEEHRRRGYATRAIRLLRSVGDHLGQRTLWILIEPGNTPSRRAVERAGFRLVDEIDTLPSARALGLGPRLCRYSFTSASARGEAIAG